MRLIDQLVKAVDMTAAERTIDVNGRKRVAVQGYAVDGSRT